MKSHERVLTLVSIGVALFLPIIAFAATGAGLVPCGTGANTTATECSACDLVALIQGLLKFFIGLSIPIAVAMFAYAGVLYFTSGAVGIKNIAKAHKIFSNAFIGFVITISAWLVVNTILNAIINKSFYNEGNWFTVKCYQRTYENTKLGDVLNATLGVVTPSTSSTASSIVGSVCGVGSTFTNSACVNANTGVVSCPTNFKLDATNKCVDVSGAPLTQPAPTGGGAGFSSNVTSQAGDASGALNNLISCMGSKVGGTITSISDSNGGTTCYQDHPGWPQCTTDPQSNCCYHARNSCHYGGPSCPGMSYAVDIAGDNAAISAAANACGADYVLNEGNHVHVSVGASCGCN